MAVLFALQSRKPNGSTDFVDSGPQGVGLTGYGDIVYSDAVSKFFDTAILSDGSGDYIDADQPVFGVGTGDFTFHFWMQPNSFPSNWFIANGDQTGDVFFGGRGGTIGVGRVGVAWDQEVSSGLVTTTIQHVAFVRESGVLTIYVDGTAVTSGSNTNSYNVTNFLRLFRQNNYYYNGYITEIIFDDTALWVTDFTPPTAPYSPAIINVLSVFRIQHGDLLQQIFNVVHGVEIYFLVKTFRVLYGDIVLSKFRASHGLFPQVLKVFRALPGAAPLRSKTFRVVHDQARSFVKVFRVLHQQSTFIQAVFRVLHQQQDGVVLRTFRVMHGSKAGEAVFKVFRAMHGLIQNAFRSDDFDVSLKVGDQPVLSWSAATLSTDEGRFVWEAQVSVHNKWDAETLLGQYDPVVYHRYGVDYHLIVVDRSRAAAVSDDAYTDTWTVDLASPAYRLSAGIALPITKTWPRGTAAKEIVQELCDAKSITLDWQVPEYVLAELVAEKQSPIDIIRTVCNVIGALPQSAPSGALIIRPETPVMPDGKAVPDTTFAALSIVQLSEQSDDPAVLYNAVQVSDSTEPSGDAGGLQHEEADRTDGGKDIKGWNEPWGEISLRVNSAAGETTLSSGKLVVVDYLDSDGEPEWVQFVDGKATASRPVYQGFSVVDFRGVDPGQVSWNPDQKELVAANGGEHYVQIAYQWRYYAFVYHSVTGETYQLVLTDG